MAIVTGKFAKALWPGVNKWYGDHYGMATTDGNVTPRMVVAKSTLIDSDRDVHTRRRKARLKVNEVERVAAYIIEAINDPDMEITDYEYENINRILLRVSDEATKVKQRGRSRSGTVSPATTPKPGARTAGKTKNPRKSMNDTVHTQETFEEYLAQQRILEREYWDDRIRSAQKDEGSS